MCGIIGITGHREAAPLIFGALKHLEYRGYDSAGIATYHGPRQIHRARAEGKLINLEKQLAGKQPLPGTIGIGHTRWATHGLPNETNAHPHATDKVAVVHNGIIENFRELRDEMVKLGYTLHSQTDTEVVPILVTHYFERGHGAARRRIAETVKTPAWRLRAGIRVRQRARSADRRAQRPAAGRGLRRRRNVPRLRRHCTGAPHLAHRLSRRRRLASEITSDKRVTIRDANDAARSSPAPSPNRATAAAQAVSAKAITAISCRRKSTNSPASSAKR